MSSHAPGTSAPEAAASARSGGGGLITPIAATSEQAGDSAVQVPAPAILYSFRRCPYAIRARLGLAAAGLRPGRELALREVSLRSKPPELLAASANGRVPVLVLPTGGPGAGGAEATGAEATLASPDPAGADQGLEAGRGSSGAVCRVLAESLAILRWALELRDEQGWLTGWSSVAQSEMAALIAENDGAFKRHLDRFKYAGRYGSEGLEQQQEHRVQGLAILRAWNLRLLAGGWLLGSRACLADMALLPFVRQFRLADPDGFDAERGLEAVHSWLQRFLDSDTLRAVMQEPWAPRSPWRSPGWLYHLALSEEWQGARAEGVYCRSSRGLSLQQVGFIHASHAHQIAGTYRRFYADLPAGAVRLLTIDPARLAAAGVAVVAEPAPESGELFPHLYGALPTEAVLRDEPYPP